MTLDELKAALDAIPDKGVINKARRHAIQKQIFKLLMEARAEKPANKK